MEPCIARFVFYITNEMQITQYSLLLSAFYMFRVFFSAHHQELIKLYVQPCVLSCFPSVYRWCGWVGQHIHTSGRQQESMTIPKLHIQFFKLLMMGGKTARNM